MHHLVYICVLPLTLSYCVMCANMSYGSSWAFSFIVYNMGELEFRLFLIPFSSTSLVACITSSHIPTLWIFGDFRKLRPCLPILRGGSSSRTVLESRIEREQGGKATENLSSPLVASPGR